MKKIVLLLILCVNISVAQENETEISQENKLILNQENKEISVENHLFNFYITGGTVANYEFKMTNRFAFRTELAFSFTSGALLYGFIFNPSFSFSVEPRFYYDLDNALKKNKNIHHNPGRYLALRTSISIPFNNRAYLTTSTIIETILIIGIRKNFLQNFSGEIGFGIGIGTYRDLESDSLITYLALSTPMRIGLTFSL